MTPADIRLSVVALLDTGIAESAFSRVRHITAASNNLLTRRNASEIRVIGAKVDEAHIGSGTTTEPSWLPWQVDLAITYILSRSGFHGRIGAQKPHLHPC